MAVYDSKRHRMITLGGAWYDKFDTWALSLDEAPTWTRIDGAGETPPPGAGGRAVYDPNADRVALDRAYADAMGALAARYPDDPDASVLYAEALMDLHPWDLAPREAI